MFESIFFCLSSGFCLLRRARNSGICMTNLLWEYSFWKIVQAVSALLFMECNKLYAKFCIKTGELMHVNFEVGLSIIDSCCLMGELDVHFHLY